MCSCMRRNIVACRTLVVTHQQLIVNSAHHRTILVMVTCRLIKGIFGCFLLTRETHRMSLHDRYTGRQLQSELDLMWKWLILMASFWNGIIFLIGKWLAPVCEGTPNCGWIRSPSKLQGLTGKTVNLALLCLKWRSSRSIFLDQSYTQCGSQPWMSRYVRVLLAWAKTSLGPVITKMLKIGRRPAGCFSSGLSYNDKLRWKTGLHFIRELRVKTYFQVYDSFWHL